MRINFNLHPLTKSRNARGGPQFRRVLPTLSESPSTGHLLGTRCWPIRTNRRCLHLRCEFELKWSDLPRTYKIRHSPHIVPGHHSFPTSWPQRGGQLARRTTVVSTKVMVHPFKAENSSSKCWLQNLEA